VKMAVCRKQCYTGVIVLLVALAMIVTGCPLLPDPPHPPPYTTHPGPSLDLEIRTWYDLDAIRDNLAGHHRLMNDLDATTAGYEELAGRRANEGTGWKPIISENYGFSGSLDGQGYEIRDLFIDRPDEDNVGLFALSGGLIKDVGVVNIDVTGRKGVGSLVGMSLGEGSIGNSYSAGSVAGNQRVGGLIGHNLRDHTVTNSFSTGSVVGHWEVGGLVGANYEGIVAHSYSAGNVTGEGDVGGLVGANRGVLSNCYAAGSVTGKWWVGGLVGVNRGIVENSHSVGSVAGVLDVGGLIGTGEPGATLSNSFWDVEASGIADSDGGTGKTTAEMMSIATLTDTATEGLGEPWDVVAVAPGETNSDHIWNIVDGQTYPFLSWQSVP